MVIIVFCSTPNVFDLPAFLYKSISKEHTPVMKEFPDWVELLSEFTLERLITFENKNLTEIGSDLQPKIFMS